ncbi:MAG: FkbM family methyltransferase [Chitinophagaceae bacterium]
MLKALFRGAMHRIKKFSVRDKRKISRWNRILIKHQQLGKINSFQFKNEKINYVNPGEFLFGFNEIFEDEIYKIKFSVDNPFVIDCGANIGLSVLYFKMIYPKSKIIAFEPDAKNFELLQQNIKSFNLKDVTIFQSAVWIKNGSLFFENKASQASRIVTSINESENYVEVNTVRLKDVLQKQKVDLLKIDIEGAEYDILKDCSDALSLVDNLFVEYHGAINEQNKLLELLNIVVKQNFNFYISSAAQTIQHPFLKEKSNFPFEQQLNIFCYKKP